MFKKMSSVLFLLVILVSSSFATAQMTTIILNGETLSYSEDSGFPFIDENERTQVPFRLTLEKYGAEVSWDAENSTAIAVKDGIIIQVPIGEAFIFRNGIMIENDTKSMVKDGRTFLPIRIVMEAMDAEVGWDNDTQSVLITGKTAEIATEDNTAGEGSQEVVEPIVETLVKGKFDYTNSYNSNKDMTDQEIYELEKFDLRLEKELTPVKDQGDSGSCWAFAAFGAVEGVLDPELNLDLSEDNLIMDNPFIVDYESGGYRSMAVAYMASWNGPILESEDAFGDNKANLEAEEVFHLQEAIYVENSLNELKKALINYGPVHCGIYANDPESGEIDEAYFDIDHNAYIYVGNADANHDVVIVGWDDNFPKENFKTMPQNNGAYIVRNSWGVEWGEAGYYYVSYSDSRIGIEATVYSRLESNDNYDHIYQYDLSGANSSMGYSETYAYMANVFEKKSETEILKAASFYTLGANTRYTVFYVDGYESKDDLIKKTELKSGILQYEGYHTIGFEGVPLDTGKKFAIVVYLDTENQKFPLPVNVADDSNKKEGANPGESFISYNGEAWEDLTGGTPTGNVTIKGFTNNK